MSNERGTRGEPVWPRVLPLPRGRTLVVRPIEPDDRAGVAALYHDLSLEDRYRRFFSAFRPSDAFLERWCRPEDDGGFGVVAVLTDGDERRLVAEAGCRPLPSGDAEFAITVASDWRGWLGPYLLDTLVDLAKSRDIPNLVADILLENRLMLALVRQRGYATLEHDDFTVVRAMIGVRERTPVWPGDHERPRVLVEVPGGRWAGAAAAGAAGLQVVGCPGANGGGLRCPALQGEVCPLAEAADVILVDLRPGTGTDCVIAAHTRLHREASLVIQQRGGAEGTLAVPEGAIEVDRGTPVQQVVDLLSEQARARR
jgi:hypothetical protein